MHLAYIVGMKAGLEAFIYREIEELMKKGLQITLFATKLNKDDIYSPKPEWRYIYYSPWRLIIMVPLLFWRHPWRHLQLLVTAIRTHTVIDLMLAIAFSRHMRHLGIDLIHSTYGDRKLFVAYYCKQLAGLPLTTTIHAHEIHANPNNAMFVRAARACDKIITIAHHNQKLLCQNFGLPADKIVVIKLSVDLELFSNRRPKQVLTISRFTERKGYDILFEAIQRLDRDDVEFIIVGFGPLNVQQLAIRYGVADRIIFFDKMNPRQLKFFYQNCDLFCLPSKTTKREGQEGIPVVLMEAMACGLPIVATNNGAIAELVPEIIVPENNAGALADGLRQALSKIPAPPQRGDAHRRIIETTHGPRNIDELSTIFEQVLANAAADRSF
ncbi:MAG: glycosyltransferase [candidate division KSB1 bacterium]|nr:glycosyltransferase [candidate division KSB1 bacterium]MDZ7319509.1 glycosyltransferase [candidate division KSB1 bacterium]MDZ7342468.1 glycosyltransferase [candidate division KSB1 bacterium]